MIKVEHVDVWGFEYAIRGMRNPMNSWEKSDSNFSHDECATCPHGGSGVHTQICDGKHCFSIGKNDLKLMQQLYKAGTSHRKYLRQIFVSMDITAPLYWWKEFDTYKVGTVANSCSTMHKIQEKEFTLDDFSHEHLYGEAASILEEVVEVLNFCRETYLSTKDKDEWWQMIQLLPSSYDQRRTVTMTYENAVAMIEQRSNHKLDEWRTFVEVLKGLPYLPDIMEGDSK